MDREKAIEIISCLYPADSENADSALIGEMLLKQAQSDVKGWRTEPTEILVRYAELCLQKEKNDIS